MKKKKTESSPAMQLMTLVWDRNSESTPHSWERLNHAMRAALSLAIRSGLRFDPGDFDRISKDMRYGYWITDDGGEWAYALAVCFEHRSFCQEWERFKGRQAFMGDDVAMINYEGGVHGSFLRRARGRLAVRATFEYAGEQLTVTSFSEDGQHLTACTHKPQKDGEHRRKISRRFKVTHDDLKRDRAERREKAKLLEEMEKLPKPAQKAVAAALKVATVGDYLKLPIAKIRRAMEKAKKGKGL